MKLWPKKRWKQILCVLFLCFFVISLTAMVYLSVVVNREPIPKDRTNIATLLVSSSAFENGTLIPQKYTVQGENVNPPLTVDGLPEETESLVIIVEDPVALPVIAWNHWIVWNVPPNVVVDENSDLGVQGKNGWNKNVYSGPDPIFGVRNYSFTVYALDVILDISSDSSKGELLRAMDNHVIGRGMLYGNYEK